MTQLRIETYTMPAARLGPQNPLPALHAYHTVTLADPSDAASGEPTTCTDRPGDETNEASILPYQLQDDYDRVKSPRGFKAAVLENDILRATFLLELGGRLWSLYHKPTGRELLHVNPVFQPANLAVRDAWFSGGVEWNLSIIGHCPFTCSPLFAAGVRAADGSPVLRLYEFERIRGVRFQIDCSLPDGSAFLFVRPRLHNPQSHPVPMYWWSNVAVDQAKGTRVLAPADHAYYHAYDRTLRSHALPLRDGRDVTCATRQASAADLYFRIPPGRRPWVAALDSDGRGLIHTSTQRLCGRKMFVWGTDPGGRRWQEHLATPQSAYLEIQGGLATKQTEYLPMPAGATWEWLEAYGALEADAAAVHADDWPAAVSHVEQRLEAALARSAVEERLNATAEDADRPPTQLFQRGSGWGALEDRRRVRCGLAPVSTAATPFDADSLAAEQAPWLQLLETGTLPYRPPTQAPGAYATDSAWRELLEEAVAAGRGVHWLSLLHLGVMRYRAADRREAREAWERSMRLEPSAWACRNLAVLASDEGDLASSADAWLAAARLKPDLPALVIEACEALLRAERFETVAALLASVPTDVANLGRVRLLRTVAALRSGDLIAPQVFFSTPCDIANIREGELSLSELWSQWHQARLSRLEGVPVDEALRQRVAREYPLPREFDFRMTAADVPPGAA